MHVVAAGWVEHILLHEVLVFHATLLFYNHGENHVAQIAVAFAFARSIAQVALQENLEQGRVIRWRLKMVLHHDVAGGRYRVTGIVVETCLMAQQLFYGDVVISLVLDTVVVNGIAQDSLFAKHLLVQLEFLHLLQLHDTYGCNQFRYRGEAHQHVRLHSDASLLIRHSESAGIE